MALLQLSFNPHPSLLTGEFYDACGAETLNYTFQSTPVIADG